MTSWSNVPGGGLESASIDSVFVYGTLVPGDVRWHIVEPYVVGQRRARVPGRVFDTGLGYPAARFDGGGVIEGWLLELDPGSRDAALRLLDRVEGAVQGLYLRTTVTTTDGTTAWAYEFGDETDGMLDLDGRWHAV